jgi:hypothetical protein
MISILYAAFGIVHLTEKDREYGTFGEERNTFNSVVGLNECNISGTISCFLNSSWAREAMFNLRSKNKKPELDKIIFGTYLETLKDLEEQLATTEVEWKCLKLLPMIIQATLKKIVTVPSLYEKVKFSCGDWGKFGGNGRGLGVVVVENMNNTYD